MEQSAESLAIEIPPRRSVQHFWLFGAICFFALGCLFVALPFLDKDSGFGYSGLGAAFLAIGVFILMGRSSARRVYVIEDEGIRILNRSGQVLRWADVADISLLHPLGVGELSAKFFGAGGKKIASISCEFMADGGRVLVDQLHKRLPAIFDRHARRFLTGEDHWRLGAMQDVVRFENGMLVLNVPRPRLIPFHDIRRIEWIPGVVSGARRGGVIFVEFGGERVELQVKIHGIQFFLFAAKYMFGLGERVNPPFPAESRAKIDDARRQQHVLYFLRSLSFMLIVWPFVFFLRDVPDYINDQATEETGVARTASIANIKGTSVELQYKDRDKNPQTATVRVQKSFADAHRVGDKFKIKVHRNNPQWVLFDGKIRHSEGYLTRSLQFSAVVACMGIALALWTELRKRRLNREAERLEREAVAAIPRH